MSRSSLQYTPAARVQLRAIGEYTEGKWGKGQRDLYFDKLFAGFDAIRKSPKKGRLRSDLFEGMLSRRVEKHIAYYFVEKDRILIVGVLHERMDPTRHL